MARPIALTLKEISHANAEQGTRGMVFYAMVRRSFDRLRDILSFCVTI